VTRYVKWRKPRGGVKHEDGTGRLCMHCGKDAVHAATLVTGKFKMSVWFCDDHATTLKGGGK
jgi:hypothetical protein